MARILVSITFLVAVMALILSGRIAASSSAPSGWFLAGSAPADYVTGSDAKTMHGGKGSAYLASKTATPKGFGTLMSQFVPNEYLGKRVRLTAWVRSEKVDEWAG